MGTRKIVTLGDDTLRKHCKPQEKFDRRLATLLKDMAETMYKAEGVGLAAPQVGILRRAAVVDVTEDHSGLLELVNPEIIEREGEQTGREGCLSVPGRQGVVTRPMKSRCGSRTGTAIRMSWRPKGSRPGPSATSWTIWTDGCIST